MDPNPDFVDALQLGLPDESVVLDTDILNAHSMHRAMYYCPAGKAMAGKIFHLVPLAAQLAAAD